MCVIRMYTTLLLIGYSYPSPFSPRQITNKSHIFVAVLTSDFGRVVLKASIEHLDI